MSTALQSVRFPSFAQTVVGELHAPASGAPDRKGAAVVVSHPMTGVKEQTATDYAKALAAAGFYALTFDAAYQGESTGEPRGLEFPQHRAEDIKSGVTYLTTLKAAGKAPVDPEKIGVVGICASGGYASYAAQSDVRIKAVATVSAADVGRMVRNAGVLPSCTHEVPEAYNGARQGAAQYRTEAAVAKIEGKPEPDAPFLLNTNPAALPADTDSFSRGAAEYYGTKRGSHARSDQRVPRASFDLIVNYDSFAFQHLISPRPLLMIAGSAAETLHHSEEAVARAHEPKELFVVQGQNHFGLYDDLTQSGPKLAAYFGKYLA